MEHSVNFDDFDKYELLVTLLQSSTVCSTISEAHWSADDCCICHRVVGRY